MQLDVLSSSYYNNYSDCAWKFFLISCCFEQDVAGASALLGTISHKVLELLARLSIIKHRKDSKYWDYQYLWQICFNHFFNKKPEIAQKIEPSKIKKVVLGLKELVEGEYSPISENVIHSEREFIVSMEGKRFKLESGSQFVIRGTIDRIDKTHDPKIIIIHDYKSGQATVFPSKEPITPDYLTNESIQPAMYFYAAMKMFPHIKEVIVLFHYFSEKITIPAIFTEKDLPRIEDKIYQRFNTIKNDNDTKRNISWRCKSLCHFGPKTGICENAWKEKEQFGQDFVEKKYQILNEKSRYL